MVLFAKSVAEYEPLAVKTEALLSCRSMNPPAMWLK